MMKNHPHPGELRRKDVLAALGIDVTEAAGRLGMARARSTVAPTSAQRFDFSWPGASWGQSVTGAGLAMRPQVDLLPQMFWRSPSSCRICEWSTNRLTSLP